MPPFHTTLSLTRRRLLQLLAFLGLGGAELLRAADALADESDAWPGMTYRTLGRTGFEGSRLVFGCGAALMFRRRRELLDQALEHGVNVFDVGTSDYYRWAESNLADFARQHRDRIFLISKGFAGILIKANEEMNREQCVAAARRWSDSLDKSLRNLKTDHVDAYYVMAANNTSLIRSEEMYEAFLAAKQAGKVDHWGISTHENAAAVLDAASETGWYSLAQIAVTPAGWYDYWQGQALPDSPPMPALRPVLDRARAAGIGLIGMKAARFLAGRFLGLGPDRPTAFDAHYPEKLMAARLSAFQRSYAFVLAHGLDAVNADSQSLAHLRENFTAAATAESYFA